MRRRGILAAVAAAFVGVVVFVGASSGATPPPTASASVSGGPQFVNDKAGVIYTFTVTNTDTTPIGGVKIIRPTDKWKIVACLDMPANWRAPDRHDDSCRFRSQKDPGDDIGPGQTATFSLEATTNDAPADLTGVWKVQVARTDKFDPANSTFATPTGDGLGAIAYSFEILDAVVANGPATPGSPCPASNKQAVGGTTVTMVICGKNRTSAKLTPTAAQSSLSGTFIDSVGGPFTSGLINAHSANVVLGNWANVHISTSKGTNKTVVTKTGASATATSPLTTLGGYEVLNQPPTANNDGPYTLNQGTTLTVPAPGVLGNDTDPDNDPLTAVLVSGPSHAAASGFTLNADGSFSYTPDASYFGPDSFTYKANDGSADSNVATVSLTVNPGVSIGNFVWEDQNANGIQDAGEPGIAGVTLTLTGTKTAGGAVTDHATTDASGHYFFTESPGTYTVTVDAGNFAGALAGYTPTPTLQGPDRSVDSNPNPSGTTPSTLPSGASDLTLDFGYYRPVTTGDFVWNDTNGNGIQDAGEPGINGVTLTLTGTTGAGSAVTDHATTSGNGAYLFTEAPGTYTVTVDASNFAGAGPLAGYTATPTLQGADRSVDSNPNPSGTTPGALPSGGSDLTIDFGFYQPVRTGDFVWNDLNGNGIQDAGEPGINGVTVTLTGTTGAGDPVTDHTTTSGNGAYLYTEAPGTYTVTVDASNFAGGGVLAGYTATPSLQGPPALDSNPSPSGTTPAALPSGAVDLTIDFGYYQPVTIGDFIWSDSNLNGLQDAGEPGINGVTVTLTGTDGTGSSITHHATTSGNGGYFFTEAPGTYTVTVDASNFAAGGTLEGYDASPTLVGPNRAVDSNPNPSGTTPATLSSGASDQTVDFGYIPPNQPPVNHLPGAQSTNEDTTLTLSSGGGNAISISDADAGSADVKVTLGVSNGTLTLNGTLGLTFSTGDGTADASMVFTGAIANINNALDGMTYTPTTDYNGEIGRASCRERV